MQNWKVNTKKFDYAQVEAMADKRYTRDRHTGAYKGIPIHKKGNNDGDI